MIDFVAFCSGYGIHATIENLPSFRYLGLFILDHDLVLVLLLGQDVDVFQQLDIVLAETRLVSRVLILVSLEFFSENVQVLLHLVSLGLEEGMLV